MDRLRSALARYGYPFAVLAIVLSTAIFFPGRDHFAKGQWALLYLLIVVVVAGVSGTGPAILAALLAFLSWDFFFLPPYRTLRVADPKDWLALAAFLAVGMLMGIQTGRMREREARALAREHESALLNTMTASLVSETSTETMARTVLAEIVQLLGAASATLFVADEAGLHRFCAEPPSDAPDTARDKSAEWVFTHDQPLGLPKDAAGAPAASQRAPHAESTRALGTTGGTFLPLHSPSGVAGVLTVQARLDGPPYNSADGRLLASLANLVAVFLERQRLQATATQAEALREADRLKSSLLSSVSHELKTPLAALTATVSNLLESDVAWDEASVRDELRAIVADITRLNNSIGALLDLSRLEAHAWEPVREPYDLSEILSASLDTLPAHHRDRVAVTVPDDLPPLVVDLVQWTRVFQNLLENAVLYAGETSPIRVRVTATPDAVRCYVEDEGPGIPPDEHEAVFEKFYRGRRIGTQAPTGTGLGLAITREIVHAHGGAIHVEDASPHGARFVITLPLHSVASEAS